jgi:hypothetical protein
MFTFIEKDFNGVDLRISYNDYENGPQLDKVELNLSDKWYEVEDFTYDNRHYIDEMIFEDLDLRNQRD